MSATFYFTWDDPHLALRLLGINVHPFDVERIMQMDKKAAAKLIFPPAVPEYGGDADVIYIKPHTDSLMVEGEVR